MTGTDWAALADRLDDMADFDDVDGIIGPNLRLAAVGLRRLAQLDTAIRDRHTPEEQEAEVWWGDADHDQRFPDCLSGDDCEGHVTTITVCSECGYSHDGETPIFRQWPCPTLAAVAARDFGTGNPTATSEDDQR